MKFISVPVFILSLAIGIFVVYISQPPTQVIYVYPNPENEDRVLFKDKADNCFRFTSKEVKCPNDDKQINLEALMV